MATDDVTEAAAQRLEEHATTRANDKRAELMIGAEIVRALGRLERAVAANTIAGRATRAIVMDELKAIRRATEHGQG